MYEFFTVILPLAIAVLISWGLAKLGSKRKIGFFWSFYFGILNPMIALWIILFSQKKEAATRKISIVWKPIAVFLLINGILLLYSSSKFSTRENEDQNLIENQAVAKNKINTGDLERDLILNDSAANFGKIVGGGVISIFVKDTSRTNHYFKLYAGLLLISIAIFIFTRKIEKESDLKKSKIVNQPRNPIFQEEAIFQKKADSEFLTRNQGGKGFDIKKWMTGHNSNSINIRSIIGSIVVGFSLGWIYKVPNSKLTEMLLQAPSQWKMEMALSYYRKKSSFFSTELFDFNWGLFVVSSMVIFFSIRFLQDNNFRERIFKKLKLKD